MEQDRHKTGPLLMPALRYQGMLYQIDLRLRSELKPRNLLKQQTTPMFNPTAAREIARSL
jgi:hypothetical protein